MNPLQLPVPIVGSGGADPIASMPLAQPGFETLLLSALFAEEV